jgi:two-component system, OmpR family, phosphate regulon sensor histidine kinase PhoR
MWHALRGSFTGGRLVWRISAVYLALILSVLLGLALYVAAFTRSTYIQELETQLGTVAAVAGGEAALALQADLAADLQPLATRVGAHSQARVTLIALDGRVLGDSVESPELMENHAHRPEVIDALAGQRGISLRQSATLGYDMLYVAVPMGIGTDHLGVARASLPLRAVDQAATALVGSVALAIVFAGLAAVGLALWLGRSIAEPIRQLTKHAGAMADGDLKARAGVNARDEIGELGRAFNRMADRLVETIDNISAERNRLSAILEAVADGLVMTDTDGRVLLLNPGAERLLRASWAQAVGQPFIEVSRDHELTDLLARADRQPRLIELGLPRRQVRAIAAEIPGTGGQRLLLLQDVTALHRLESVRRDFVANVSHELRTPLAAMMAVVETLEDGALDDPVEARAFLSRLHGEVDQLTELVRELLELSRIESGQAEIHPEPTDPATLLQAAAARLDALAQRNGVDLRSSFPANLPVTLADPPRINQVLANLLHNAIKFTPPGGQIELRAADRGDELAISVADTGVGIPPDDLDRVFERFFKSDRSRSSGGTGLGLAIAKHLVQAHGGRIWAESGGVRGTTFTFTLPLASDATVVAPLGEKWQRS